MIYIELSGLYERKKLIVGLCIVSRNFKHTFCHFKNSYKSTDSLVFFMVKYNTITRK